MEWLENGILRGGGFGSTAYGLAAPLRINLNYPTAYDDGLGFRVASIPEPGTGLLLMTGLALAYRQRRHA